SVLRAMAFLLALVAGMRSVVPSKGGTPPAPVDRRFAPPSCTSSRATPFAAGGFDNAAPRRSGNDMTLLLRSLLAALTAVLVAAPAHAHEAGWMQIQVAGIAPDAQATTVALYYPTTAAPRAVA